MNGLNIVAMDEMSKGIRPYHWHKCIVLAWQAIGIYAYSHTLAHLFARSLGVNTYPYFFLPIASTYLATNYHGITT